MFTIEAIHHIAILTSTEQYEESKRFYTEILGFTVLSEVFRKERNSYKLDLALNGLYQVELFSFPDYNERASFPEAKGLRHLAFAVKDVQEGSNWLRSKGVRTEEVRVDEFTGKQFLFFMIPTVSRLNYINYKCMVEVTQIDKIGEDERGATHYFDTDRTGQFIIAYRKAGSASGRHYHKGTAKNKNPEKVIIISGEATVNWFDVRGEAKGSCKAIAPAMVTVQPWAWHEVIADTDIVVFELNALEDGREDTYRI